VQYRHGSMEKAVASLSAAGVDVAQVIHHAAVDTAEAQAESLKSSLGAGDVVLKNLVFKDKKKQHFLVCTPHDAKLDFKELGKAIGAKQGIRMVDSAALPELLGVPQGSVTPLAVVNDEKKEVIVALSADLEKASKIYVHPFVNTASVPLSFSDLVKYLKHFGHEPKVVDMSAPPASGDSKEDAKPRSSSKAESKESSEDAGKKGREALMGIETPKSENFSKWYTQVVTRSEMIDYYDVSGCYILRPWSFFVWESIQSYFDALIKKSGVKNAYFPLFVSQKALMREKDHIEGFAPEVAWVTKAGKTDLEEPIAIRPTSETIMYQSFSNWIRSHRDLPFRINQWSNVVRWEFKNPTPFVRSREFLWQEGHSAFATKEEAEREVLEILDMYASVYEDLLAVPVTKGKKTENEKFAGALYTTTVEVFVPAAGRGIQAATSHCLGQNFAKMFEINFEDQGGKSQLVWQNSWGLSTRSLGVMIMVHGDDKGLVMPPKVAPIQVILVPIFMASDRDLEQPTCDRILEIENDLNAVGIRVESDLRRIHSPGWKFAQWELKGVPLRIEIGPKNLRNKNADVVRRDNGERTKVDNDGIVSFCQKAVLDIHQSMYEKAKRTAAEKMLNVTTWNEFLLALNKDCRVLAPFCDTVDCELQVRERSGEECSVTLSGQSGAAKSLCTPFSQPPLAGGMKCFQCGNLAVNWTLFGRSY